MTEIEMWSKWESQTVNGLFPLKRFLGRSNHRGVFLTECKTQKAAIKLLAEDPATAGAQLSRWQRVAALSHPHLIRILDMGRCKLGGHPFLFVVMEYAEQTLAQILPQRALTADETREMLTPSLGALSYLHRKNLVQAELKPPNFLVVNDQLKLASDTIRSAGERHPSGAKPAVYDAPETRTNTIETASDVWSLGVTLVEALTQSPPDWTNERTGEVRLPATIPPDFADILRKCLSRNPATRPTISELQARLTQGPQIAAPKDVQPLEVAAPALEPAHPAQSAATKPVSRPSQAPSGWIRSVDWGAFARWFAPGAAVGLVVLLIVWAAMRPFGSRDSPPSAPAIVAPASSSQQPVPQIAAVPRPAAPTKSAALPSSVVVHQEIPVVSRGIRDSVRGTIKVAVLVTVDRSGDVVAETLESRGPSNYFARVAADAAKKWRFAPADAPASRQWLLQFEFTRAGAAAEYKPRAT
jgi:outer membrane biosynthesis protein TonB